MMEWTEKQILLGEWTECRTALINGARAGADGIFVPDSYDVFKRQKEIENILKQKYGWSKPETDEEYKAVYAEAKPPDWILKLKSEGRWP